MAYCFDKMYGMYANVHAVQGVFHEENLGKNLS